MWKKIIITSLILLPSISFGATYGSNFLTSGTPSASSYDTTYTPAKAFDGNTATNWFSNYTSATPQYLIYDLGTTTTKQANKATIMPYTTAQGTWAKNFTISGSNNLSDWIFLSTSTFTNNTTNTFEDFVFNTNTSSFRYYKFNFTDQWYEPGGVQIGIIEAQLFECTDCDTSTSTESTSTIRFMSPELDTLILYLLYAGIAIAVAWITKKTFFN